MLDKNAKTHSKQIKEVGCSSLHQPKQTSKRDARGQIIKPTRYRVLNSECIRLVQPIKRKNVNVGWDYYPTNMKSVKAKPHEFRVRMKRDASGEITKQSRYRVSSSECMSLVQPTKQIS